MTRWAVIGAGLSGLVLAERLAEAGHAVTVFDGADHVGGLADGWTIDTPDGPLAWDRHYHVTLASDTATRSVLGRLGLERELRWVETGTGYHSNGRLHPCSSPADFARLPLPMRSKARLALTVTAAGHMHDWRDLEGKSVERWLVRWGGRDLFDRFWLPLLRAKVGDAWPETSAALIWATVQRLTAARRAGLGAEQFGYLPGGWGRVGEAYRARLESRGVQFALGHQVTRVRRTGPGRPVLVQRGGAPAIEADEAVVTVAAPLAARIVDGLRGDERDRLKGARYQGLICPSLVLRRPLSPYYLTYLMDPAPFTTVIEMSAFVAPEHLDGHHLVYLPRYCAPDEPGFGLDDSTIVARAFEGLRSLHPSLTADDLVASRVSRVRHVFAVPTVGWSRRMPPPVTSTGIHLTGSGHLAHATLNVDETVRQAERTARRLLGRPAPNELEAVA